ncbi:MAG: hypothetical protein KAI17_23525 [Thiotrichaceae bacterium]|nr:hypothetical protein [Thiotrichaceae bacterium]
MKATAGVGDKCTPAEAAKDMSKEAIGIEDKGVIENNPKKDEVGLAKKAAKKAIDCFVKLGITQCCLIVDIGRPDS